MVLLECDDPACGCGVANVCIECGEYAEECECDDDEE